MAVTAAVPSRHRAELCSPRWHPPKRRRRRVVAARRARPPKLHNESERFIAGLLDDLRIEWVYEPRPFVTALVGRAKHALKPDFWLPEYDVFVEVTEAHYDKIKRQLIKHVMRRHPVRIILIDREQLGELRENRQSLLQLIGKSS